MVFEVSYLRKASGEGNSDGLFWYALRWKFPYLGSYKEKCILTKFWKLLIYLWPLSLYPLKTTENLVYLSSGVINGDFDQKWVKLFSRLSHLVCGSGLLSLITEVPWLSVICRYCCDRTNLFMHNGFCGYFYIIRLY